jgi:uncharacterized repeat protein (TIGR02543 family)
MNLLNFVSNHAGITFPSRHVRSNEPIEFLPDPAPLVPIGSGYGYHFVGWFYPDTAASTAGRRQITESTLYDLGNNATIKAKWEANPWQLRLIANGGRINDMDTLYRTEYFNRSVGYIEFPHRNGADFLGWFDVKQDATSGMWTMQPNELQSNDIYMWDYDRTFYAHWFIRTDTIYFDAQGGISVPAKKGLRYGAKIGALPIPVRHGYTFLGWHTTIFENSPIVSDTMTYRVDGSSTIYAHWLRNSYNVRLVVHGRSDTMLNILYGEKIIRPQPDPQLADRAGNPMIFDGWYPSGLHTNRWDFSIDSVTDNITLIAQWLSEPSFIDELPQASLMYGSPLSEAHIVGGTYSFNQNRGCTGRFAFTAPNIYPTIADSGITKYEIVFIPDDSIYYRKAYDSICVHVNRRNLIISARTTSLILNEDNAIKAPGEWSDVTSYLSRRWDIEGYALSDKDILTLSIMVSLEHESYRYQRLGYYKEALVPHLISSQIMSNGILANYNIVYKKGDLYVSRINFLAPDSIIYGERLTLTASHYYPQYAATLRYGSTATSNLYVGQDYRGQWEAAALRVGSAMVCAFSDGNTAAHVQPDTMCAEIKVVPRRGVVIRASNITRVYGLRLPREYNLVIDGLHSPTEIDTLYRAGLRSEAIGASCDTPPAGQYNIQPCCISHPNYADFKYESGILTIFAGGTRTQRVTFVDSLTPTVIRYSANKKISVWAVANTQIERSRYVKYESSNSYIAAPLDNTENSDTTQRFNVFNDIIWGKKFLIRRAGSVEITAYNEGDSEIKAAYAVRTIIIAKDSQNIDFVLPATIDEGETITMQASSSSGLPVYYYISGGDIASVEIHDGILSGIQIGIVRITAIQPGNENYYAAQVERTLAIIKPNIGRLLNLKLSKGTLNPPFDPRHRNYEYSLPCSADTLTLIYDHRSTARINNEDIDSIYVVEAFPKYRDIVIDINPRQDLEPYRLWLRPTLSKDYIYYSPERFPNRMEVINNPVVLEGRRFNRYRWYKDGEPLNDTSGILYAAHGFQIGSIYSAMAYYDTRSVYNVDSVYICGQIAVLASKGFMVYPNPARDYIMVRHPEIGKTDAPIRIYSGIGDEMGVYPPKDIVINTEDNSAKLDISTLSQGAYVVKFLESSVIFIKQ